MVGDTPIPAAMKVKGNLVKALKNHSGIRYRLAAILLFTLMIVATIPQAHAHLDKPRNPAIKVTIYLESVTLLNDQDDGLDGNAEIVVKFTYLHEGHEGGGGLVTIDDFNWDYERTRRVDKKIYEHIECTPMNKIQIEMEAKEDDTDTITTIVGGLVAIAGGVVATAYSTGTALLWAGAGGIGGITALFASINSADDLGWDKEETTSPGDLLLETKNITVKFRIETETVRGVSCEEPRPTTTTTTTTTTQPLPTETTTTSETAYNSTEKTLKLAKRSLNERIVEGKEYFEELRKIIALVMEISPEPGNPGQMTESEVIILRGEAPRIILEDMIDPWIALIVKTGTDVSNVSQLSLEAIKHLYTARELVALDMYMESIDHYELAWMKSLEAMFSKQQIEYPEGMGSLQISVLNQDKEPVSGVKIGIYKDGELVETYTSGEQPYTTVLEKGNYTITAETRLLWMDLELANLPISVKDETRASLIVSETLLPVNYITVLGDATFALLAGLIVSSIAAGVSGKESLLRRTPYKVGIGLATAVLVYILLSTLL